MTLRFVPTALGSKCECVFPCSEVSGTWLVAAGILGLSLTPTPTPGASPTHSNGLWSTRVSARLIVS